MTHDPFAQVRHAHRVCGAYYPQIRGIGLSVPLIDITNDNGVNLLVEKILEHREYLMHG